MKFYTSDGCSYEGMDEATVIALRTDLGRSTTFVTEEEYNTIMAAMRAE